MSNRALEHQEKRKHGNATYHIYRERGDEHALYEEPVPPGPWLASAHLVIGHNEFSAINTLGFESAEDAWDVAESLAIVLSTCTDKINK